MVLTMADKINGIDKQKEWCEELLRNIDTPIYTSRNWRDGSGNFVPGKQKCLGNHQPPIDHRSIGSNEIVIELDAKSFSLNGKYAREISSYLKSQDIPHYNFWSGNKSIHMHIFLNIEVTDGNILKTVKEAIKKGCNIYRDIRMKFTREIITQAGLSPDLIGQGKTVDLAKLNWNDVKGKTCLIRVAGGANKKTDPLGNVKTAFKTYLMQIPETKPKQAKPWDYEDVVYPKEILRYDLDEHLVFECAKSYIASLTNPRKVKELTQIDYKGGYMTLPCIRALMEGMEEGKRSFGAQQISVAARLDKMTEEEAVSAVAQYSRNCTPVLDSAEGEKWVKWIYSQLDPYFACGNCKKLDVCETHNCSYHEEKYKEDLTIFENDDPLKVIKEALDVMIVGEDNLKMQLFLLYLTKEFGPEWCIMLDGTASSGKSHVMKKVASLFGENREEYFTYSRITEAVLNHAEDTAEMWKGKIVIIEEIQGAKRVIEQLRVLISEGELTLLETIDEKQPDGTTIKVEHEKVIKFDCLFVTCNAEETDEGDQLASRSWILNTDQSPEQTKNIIGAYLDEFSGDKSFKAANLDKIRSALQFLRIPDEVKFPFADKIKQLIPSSNVRGRRDVKKLITLVKAIAYFNQRKRVWYQQEGKQKLIADWRDVLIAFDLAGETLNASTQGVGARDLEYYEVIKGKLPYIPEFSLEDVSRWLKCGLATARKIMSNLVRAGFFENENIPPMKAKYKATSFNPVYIENPIVMCEEEMQIQEESILNWLNKQKEASFDEKEVKKALFLKKEAK